MDRKKLKVSNAKSWVSRFNNTAHVYNTTAIVVDYNG